MSQSASPLPDWLSALAAKTWVEGPLLGTVERIDDAARARAVQAASEMRAITIGRPFASGSAPTLGDWSITKSTHEDGTRVSAYDHFEVDCHGLEITHLDALNHLGVDRQWYRGFSSDTEDGISLAELASVPILTRCVFLDVAESRGESYINAEHPVDWSDLDRALARAGVDIEPGDAILVDMGRDKLEQAGHHVRPIADSPNGRPGIGESGSQWIAASGASLLGWDLNDFHAAGHLQLSVHLLIWAIGLMLVDNCDFAALREAINQKTERTGMLVVCPLQVSGATGCAVNPVVLI